MAHLCAKVALQTVCDKAALAPSPTNSREISPQSLACSGHTPFHSRATCYWIFILHQRALHMGESEKYRAWSTACQNGKGRCPEFVAGNSRWPTGHYLEPSWASSGQKLDRKQALIRHALMLLMPPDRHVGRHESGQCHSRRLALRGSHAASQVRERPGGPASEDTDPRCRGLQQIRAPGGEIDASVQQFRVSTAQRSDKRAIGARPQGAVRCRDLRARRARP